MLQEFKKFAMRGNVVDLAIGVIIGAAFGKIVDSLVTDVIMPMIGRIFGGLDFTNYFLGLTAAASQAPTYDAAKKAGATLGYGQFITVHGELHHHRLGDVPGGQGHEHPVQEGRGRARAACAADEGAGAADRDQRSPESARVAVIPSRRIHMRLSRATFQTQRGLSATPRFARLRSRWWSRAGAPARRRSWSAAGGIRARRSGPAATAVLDRHRVGLGEQQRHERGERRPGGAGAGEVVARRSRAPTSTKRSVMMWLAARMPPSAPLAIMVK